VLTVESVRRLLTSVTADALCDACLAAACATSLREMRVATETLVRSDRAFHRGSSCASCGRTVPTIVYRVLRDVTPWPIRRSD
jgi:hypothetical protein